jgi:hypothetical protein
MRLKPMVQVTLVLAYLSTLRALRTDAIIFTLETHTTQLAVVVVV